MSSKKTEYVAGDNRFAPLASSVKKSSTKEETMSNTAKSNVEEGPLVDAQPSESGMVEVTAPMDLQEGYQLEVSVGGSQRTVTVPPGGVSKGQTFKASATGGPSDGIPTGSWRDGLCACFTHGCCAAMCWFGWCCTPVLSAQVMTRMSRNCLGGNGQRPSASKTCSIVTCIWILMLIADIVLVSIMRSTYCYGGQTLLDDNASPPEYYIQCPDGSIEYPNQKFIITGNIAWCIAFAFALYMLIAVCRTRANMRRKYNIKPGCCGGCEDCCCVFWCGCCTVQQMARHTHDYKEHPVGCCSAACCNKRGQPAEIPEIENFVV